MLSAPTQLEFFDAVRPLDMDGELRMSMEAGDISYVRHTEPSEVTQDKSLLLVLHIMLLWKLVEQFIQDSCFSAPGVVPEVSRASSQEGKMDLK